MDAPFLRQNGWTKSAQIFDVTPGYPHCIGQAKTKMSNKKSKKKMHEQTEQNYANPQNILKYNVSGNPKIQRV